MLVRHVNLPLPGTISPEAKSFIDAAPPKELVPNTLEAINAFRTWLDTNWTDTPKAFAATTGVQFKNSEVGDQPVLEIAPTKIHHQDKIILYFFGGGYITGCPEDDLAITASLASHLGIKVLALRYPLAPEHPFPEAADAAFDTYRELVNTYGSENIAISGESAGGNLCMATLLNANAAGLPMPAAIALLSPWVDLAATGDSQNLDLDPTINQDTMCRAGAEAYANGIALTDHRVSPLYAEYDATFPPTLITTGTRDFLMSDAARLSTKLRSSGVDVSLHLWEGMWHVFEFYPDIPEGKQSLEEIASFLRIHLCK
jgi:monoterpene epsilon-lactone hydrolase